MCRLFIYQQFYRHWLKLSVNLSPSRHLHAAVGPLAQTNRRDVFLALRSRTRERNFFPATRRGEEEEGGGGSAKVDTRLEFNLAGPV